MEKVESILGRSLPVPSVQELAKEPLTSVPARYVRDDQEPWPLSDVHSTASLPNVPIIDMQKLSRPGELGSPELRKLHHACKDWGFFMVINHGVSSLLVEKVKAEVEKLFELPPEEKKNLRQRDGDLDGFGQAFVISEEQKLDWGDMFYTFTYPPHLRKPYIFPQLPQSFRETIEEYSKMMRKLAMEILLSIAKALNIDEELVRDLFEEGMQGMRANYYPPCPQPELVMGLTPHSDADGLTILLQVNEMEGLQIKKDGMWIPIKPLPDALIVNVGDVLEMVTNGIYRSIEHRAVVNSTKERLSISTFLWPRLDGHISPAPNLVTPETPAVFRRTSVVDYLKGFFSKELKGKSYLDVFRTSMEHVESVSLGGSLPVPWVQELAKEPLTTVPAWYVRDDQEPLFGNGTTALPEVPVIDMKKLLLPGELGSSELRKLDSACKDWGFFQVINHGVSSELVEATKAEIEKLFELPLEEKKKFWQRDGDIEGFGQAFVVSEEQKLDWGDLFYMITYPLHHRKPYLLPQLHQSFRETMEEYCKMMKNLAVEILLSMAKALKMDEEDMRELFEEGKQSIRINYYPPCPQPELVTGLTPHTDPIGLTILLQVNEMEGLQIKKDGVWIPIKPLPDAFVVNVGDILEMVTNGIYQSIEHRAMVNSTKERLSVAAFYSPKVDGDVGPAPSLITPETPAMFRRTNLVDYFKGLFSKELKVKSYLDVFRVSKDQPPL